MHTQTQLKIDVLDNPDIFLSKDNTQEMIKKLWHSLKTDTQPFQAMTKLTEECILGVLRDEDRFRNLHSRPLNPSDEKEILDKATQFFLTKREKPIKAVPLDVVKGVYYTDLPEGLKNPTLLKKIAAAEDTDYICNRLKNSLMAKDVLSLFGSSLTVSEKLLYQERHQYETTKLVSYFKSQIKGFQAKEQYSVFFESKKLKEDDFNNLPKMRDLLNRLKKTEVLLDKFEALKTLTEVSNEYNKIYNACGEILEKSLGVTSSVVEKDTSIKKCNL
jgi:hypothetical protein